MNNTTTATFTFPITTAHVELREDTIFPADFNKPGAEKLTFAFVYAGDAEGRRWIHQVRFWPDETGRAHNLVRRTIEDGEINPMSWIRII